MHMCDNMIKSIFVAPLLSLLISGVSLSPCIAHAGQSEKEIQKIAFDTNKLLLNIVNDTGAGNPHHMDYPPTRWP